jgi:hypothetical protein
MAGDAPPANGGEQSAVGVLAPSSKGFRSSAEPRAVAFKGYLLQRTLVNMAVPTASAVPAGRNDLDEPTRFDCSEGSGKCLYSLHGAVQFSNTNSSNAIGFCFLIDGLVANGICRWLTTAAEISASYHSQVLGIVHQFNVPRGAHMVRTQLSSTKGLNAISFYDLTYRSYTKRP